MCCCEGKHHGQKSKICPNFLSKERKIKILEDELKDMQENAGEIQALIAELKAEK